MDSDYRLHVNSLTSWMRNPVNNVVYERFDALHRLALEREREHRDYRRPVPQELGCLHLGPRPGYDVMRIMLSGNWSVSHLTPMVLEGAKTTHPSWRVHPGFSGSPELVVLPGHSQDDRNGAGGDGRSTWTVWVPEMPSKCLTLPVRFRG